MFFCLVVFVAYFLNAFEGDHIAHHKISKEERRKSSLRFDTLRRNPSVVGSWARNKLVLITQAFIFLVIFSIVSLAIIIYLNFVRAGANANSVTGLVFSLFPSVALGGIAWVVKRHLFREFEEEEQEASDNSEEEVKQSLIQIGKFSIGSKTRRSFRKTLKKKVNTNSAMQLLPDTASEHSTENMHQLPDTIIEIDRPGLATDTASDRPEVRKEDEEKRSGVELEGDATISLPTNGSNDSPGTDTASGGGPVEKGKQLERPEVEKEDAKGRIDIKNNGDVAFNLNTSPTNESNDSPDTSAANVEGQEEKGESWRGQT